MRIFKEIKDHHDVAIIECSGTTFRIGYMYDKSDESIYIQSDENEEPIYMNISEANVLISSIRNAISEVKDLS